ANEVVREDRLDVIHQVALAVPASPCRISPPRGRSGQRASLAAVPRDDRMCCRDPNGLCHRPQLRQASGPSGRCTHVLTVTNIADRPKACVADIDALFWESKPVPSHNVRVIDDNQRLPNDANSGPKTGPFAACFVASRRHPARINRAKSALKPNPPGRAPPHPNSAVFRVSPTHGPGGERREALHPLPPAREAGGGWSCLDGRAATSPPSARTTSDQALMNGSAWKELPSNRSTIWQALTIFWRNRRRRRRLRRTASLFD